MTDTEIPTASFVGGLGLELWLDGIVSHGRVEVQPTFFGKGTDRIRLGVLATMVDVVTGTAAHGIVHPTIDLRVMMLGHAPTSGTIELTCRPVKIGRRLYAAEVLLHAGNDPQPFARGVCTFMNQLMELGPDHVRSMPRRVGAASYDDALAARVVGPDSLAVDAHAVISEGPGGTVQGGAQALFSEVAAEHALGARAAELEAFDLDIRYFNRVRTGPIVATAQVLGDDPDGASVRVETVEPEPDGRITSLVTVLWRRGRA